MQNRDTERYLIDETLFEDFFNEEFFKNNENIPIFEGNSFQGDPSENYSQLMPSHSMNDSLQQLDATKAPAKANPNQPSKRLKKIAPPSITISFSPPMRVEIPPIAPLKDFLVFLAKWTFDYFYTSLGKPIPEEKTLVALRQCNETELLAILFNCNSSWDSPFELFIQSLSNSDINHLLTFILQSKHQDFINNVSKFSIHEKTSVLAGYLQTNSPRKQTIENMLNVQNLRVTSELLALDNPADSSKITNNSYLINYLRKQVNDKKYNIRIRQIINANCPAAVFSLFHNLDLPPNFQCAIHFFVKNAVNNIEIARLNHMLLPYIRQHPEFMAQLSAITGFSLPSHTKARKLHGFYPEAKKRRGAPQTVDSQLKDVCRPSLLDGIL